MKSPSRPSEKARQVLEKARRIVSHEKRIPFAFLFGSYAQGQEIVLSDIDIAVYFDDMDEDEKTEYEHRLFLAFDEQVNVLRLEDEDISPIIRLRAIEGIPIGIKDENFLNHFILSIIHRAFEAEIVLGRLRKL